MKRRWDNPYIAKVAEANLIISPLRDRLAPEDANRLAETIKQFDELVIELGSGSGGHLFERASLSPRTLFIGFELRYKRIFLSAKKASQAGLKNLILMKTDARHLFTIFKAFKLSGLYINFPDPWEKRRTRKNRLLSHEFLQQVALILKPGGFLSFKTDHQEYFNQVSDCLNLVKELQKIKETPDLANSEFALGNVRSEFENLFISKGLPIYFVETKRVGAN